MVSFLKKKIVWIPLLIAIIIAIWFYNRGQEEPITVETEKVKRTDIIHRVNASGKLQPEEEVQITSTITAWITEITVSEGDTVSPGQHLISLDETQSRANLEQAESVVKSAKANLRQIKLQMDRTHSLFSQNLISSQELETVEAQYLFAESQLEQAEASLKSRRDDLSKTRLLAPQFGVVTTITKEVGEMAVGGMFQPGMLMTIADLNRMEILVEVNENDVVSLSIGDTSEIEVDAFQDTIFYGTIREIAHVAETSNFGNQNQVTNFKVKIRMLSGHPLFRPGMSATANIITDIRRNVLSIPIQCLTVRSEGFESYVPKDDKKGWKSDKNDNQDETPFTKKERVDIVFALNSPSGNGSLEVLGKRVKVGISSETHYELLEGLIEGEEIVSGSYRAISRELWHKAPVQIETDNFPKNN